MSAMKKRNSPKPQDRDDDGADFGPSMTSNSTC